MRLSNRLSYTSAYTYAPELNKLHIGNTSIRTPHAVGIKEGLKKAGLAPAPVWALVVRLSVNVPSAPACGRVYNGYVPDYPALLEKLRMLKGRHNIEGTVFELKTEHKYVAGTV